MPEDFDDLVSRLQQTEREQVREPPRPLRRPGRTVHYTELTAPLPGSPFEAEWTFYQREVGRFLAEGHEGKWLLIKGEEVLGIWDALEAAELAKWALQQPALLKQVLEREPVYWIGYNRLCRS
jgi:hypothetical protein